jgi:hypothetical protein
MKLNTLLYNNFDKLVVLFLCILACYKSAYLGLVEAGDTNNYIQQIPGRTKGFGIYLSLITNLQVNFHIASAVFVCFHVAIGGVSILYLIKILCGIGFLKNFVARLLVIVLAISPYLQIFLNGKDAYIQNYLMTECLAYPLFLIVLALLIRIVFNLISNSRFSRIDFILINVFFAILISIRPQFNFFFFFQFAIVASVLVKKLVRSFVDLAFVFLVCLLPFLINPALHFIYHGHFPKPSFTTSQILTNVLFYSKSPDSLAIDDSYTRLRFLNIVRKIESDSLNFYSGESYKSHNHDQIRLHCLESDTLMHLTDSQIKLNTLNSESEYENIRITETDWILNWNRNSLKMCLEIFGSPYLLRRHFKNYLYHFFYIPVNKRDILGQKISYWGLTLFFVFLALSIVSIYKSTDSTDRIVLLVVFGVHFMNRALVILLTPGIHRFLFYSEIILLGVLLIIFINQITKVSELLRADNQLKKIIKKFHIGT